MTQRQLVYDLDNGRCVGCDKPLRRNGDFWHYHAHHVIRQNTLKRKGVRPRWWRGPHLCILLCWDCHGGQTSCMAKVPFERLPGRVWQAAVELGPWAEEALLRAHPRADNVRLTR